MIGPIPKVTHEQVSAEILDYWFVKIDGRSTQCIMQCRNGFRIYAMSTTVDPEHFDQSVGQDAAYRKAESQLWDYLAFRQFDRRARGEI